jgi:ferric-dicitrate binding protein FerR (iron transport regulator)
MSVDRHHERLGPPPVDALSDVGWARVERNLFSRVEGTVTNAVVARDIQRDSTSRSTWVWLAVPLAAAAACALTFFSMNSGPGPVSSTEPSRIVAGASPSTVTFGDAHITLEANAAVITDRNAGKPTAVLEDGTATFAVAPTQTALTVLAGDMTARTTAATFVVTRKGELASVKVDSGTVEIRFRGHDVKLAATQSWSSDRPSDVLDSKR